MKTMLCKVTAGTALWLVGAVCFPAALNAPNLVLGRPTDPATMPVLRSDVNSSNHPWRFYRVGYGR